MKEVTSVTSYIIRSVLITKLLPILKEVLPKDGNIIKIHMDNSSSYTRDYEMEWRREVELRRLQVKIVKKPPQSPDLKFLDIGYFTSIQGLQKRKKELTVNQLVQNVKNRLTTYL